MRRAILCNAIGLLAALAAVEYPSHAEFLAENGLGDAEELLDVGADPTLLRLSLPRDQEDLAERATIETSDGPAPRAVRLRVARRDAWAPAAQLVTTVPADLPQGTALLALCWARGGIPGMGGSQGMVEVVVRDLDRRGPMADLARYKLRLGNGWERLRIPVVLTRGPVAAGRCEFAFHGAFKRQRVDIADLRVYACGERRLSELPGPTQRFTYAGRAPDAAWRSAAAERIARHRRAPLRVRVRDPAGEPVPGATVRVRQVRTAFRFATVIPAGGAFHPGAAGFDPELRARALRDFDSYTVNEFYWRHWHRHSPERRLRAGETLDELAALGRPVRAHVLVWPAFRFVPEPLRELVAEDPAALRRAIEQHIRHVVGLCRGRVAIYDVVNEPGTNHEVTDLLGEGSLLRWFRLVHELDPGARTCLNEFDLLGRWHDPEGRRAKQDAHLALVRRLRAAGAPIDILGFQGHFKRPTPIPEVLATLDRFAELGCRLEITEFDMTTGDEELEADYLRDLLTACFSHPAVEGFAMWGFADHRHWLGYAPLYRRDWSPKPAAAVWRELRARWRTDAELATDAAGACELPAYRGTLLVETPGAAPATVVLADPAGAAVTLVAEP